MTENTDTTTTEKPKAPRRPKLRLENEPWIVAWCEAFVSLTEEEQGFTPTLNQTLAAFSKAARKGIEEAD